VQAFGHRGVSLMAPCCTSVPTEVQA
jgi:hypothetical protein